MLLGKNTNVRIFSTRYVAVSRLVAVWENLNITDGLRLLQEFGLPHRRGEKLRLQDLAIALEEECRPVSAPSPSPATTHQAAVITLLQEMKALRYIF